MYARAKKQREQEIDSRIHIIHQAIANKVLAAPHYLKQARDTLEKRYAEGLIRYGSYLLWDSILLQAESSPETFKALLLAQDKRTASLRRHTIFTGVLTESEREHALAANATSGND
ncbi:hypothetical protein OCL06_11715 [Alteromonas sp. ASW11-19]|uniref:Uncharacterized protein n=1 Tax=Alteromonas salexigens TaxID=2982530 RepID=A0ABT2VPL5_9ALTE|nr:hypothetical protein [Alteromonas salexigens]MCU7555261.1 hypothetical protein [Alteromonas salexigens]